jgi:undecaprenyl-diphosphatase
MDQKLLFLINREWTSGVADRVMALVSSWDAWLPLVFVFLLFLLVKGGFKARAFCLTAAAIAGINDGVLSNSLKHLIDRPRPHQVLNDVRIVDLAKAKPRILAVFRPPTVKLSRPDFTATSGRSFPSSHTINTFSVALVGVFFFGARAAWGFGLAALVGYSRIYVGSHWPSDVVTSIFLGLGSTLLLLAAADALWRWRGRVWLPAIHARHPSLFAA